MAELLRKGYKPVETRGQNLVILEKNGKEEVCELTETEIKRFRKWLKALNI